MTCLDLDGFRDGANDGPVTDEAETGETDGDVIWEVDFPARFGVHRRDEAGLGAPVSSPVILGDLVFCGTGHGTDSRGEVPNPLAPSFAALRLSDGEVVWTSAAPGENVAVGQWSSPAVLRKGGTVSVLFPGGDGVLYAFAPRTGRRRWALDLGSEPESGGVGIQFDARDRPNLFFAPPVVADGTIYVGLNDVPDQRSKQIAKPVYAVETDADGLAPRIRWRFAPSTPTFHFAGTYAAAVPDGDRVFVLSRSGTLWAVDRGTGEPLWREEFFHDAPLHVAPALADGVLYVPTEAELVALDVTGPRPRRLGTYLLDRMPFVTAPAPAGTTLYHAAGGSVWKLRTPRDLPGR